MKLPLRNVLLSAKDGLVQSKNLIWYHFDKFNWDLLYYKKNSSYLRDQHQIKARLSKGLSDPSKAINLYGTYHLGISPHIYSYYHLITDLLPHLIDAPKYPVLLPEFIPNSYTNFLRKVGFETKILPPRDFLVENLYIPEIGEIDWNKKKIKLIQTFFEKNLVSKFFSNVNNSKFKKKIYISRKLVKKRHLTNEEEFLPLLNKHNFKTVFLEKMSIQRQVQLFRSSSHLIAPHGAGLTNVLFASTDIKILEVRPVLSSGKFCYEKLFSLGWPNYEIIVPPQKGRFFLPLEELEEVLLRWQK